MIIPSTIAKVKSQIAYDLSVDILSPPSDQSLFGIIKSSSRLRLLGEGIQVPGPTRNRISGPVNASFPLYGYVRPSHNEYHIFSCIQRDVLNTPNGPINVPASFEHQEYVLVVADPDSVMDAEASMNEVGLLR